MGDKFQRDHLRLTPLLQFSTSHRFPFGISHPYPSRINQPAQELNDNSHHKVQYTQTPLDQPHSRTDTDRQVYPDPPRRAYYRAGQFQDMGQHPNTAESRYDPLGWYHLHFPNAYPRFGTQRYRSLLFGHCRRYIERLPRLLVGRFVIRSLGR